MSSGAEVASRTRFHAHKTPRRDRPTYPLKAVARVRMVSGLRHQLLAD